MKDVLSFEMVKKAVEEASTRGFGKSPVLMISEAFYNAMIEEQKWSDELKKLSPRARKQVILKRKILERRGQKHKQY